MNRDPNAGERENERERERTREREKERERERKRENERERENDRERERQREIERTRQRQRESESERERGRERVVSLEGGGGVMKGDSERLCAVHARGRQGRALAGPSAAGSWPTAPSLSRSTRCGAGLCPCRGPRPSARRRRRRRRRGCRRRAEGLSCRLCPVAESARRRGGDYGPLHSSPPAL